MWKQRLFFSPRPTRPSASPRPAPVCWAASELPVLVISHSNYSTTTSGWCDRPGRDGGGCSWRVAAAVRRVNKICSDNAIYSAGKQKRKIK